MKRKTRWIAAAIAILAALVVAEEVLRLVRGPEVLVVIDNAGGEPLDDMVIAFGSGRTVVPALDAGQSARVYLNGSGPQSLIVSFHQSNNPLMNYQIPGFDPEQMQREGFKLVLKIRPGEVERSQEEAEPATPLGRAASVAWSRFLKWFGVEPDGSEPQ